MYMYLTMYVHLCCLPIYYLYTCKYIGKSLLHVALIWVYAHFLPVPLERYFDRDCVSSRVSSPAVPSTGSQSGPTRPSSQWHTTSSKISQRWTLTSWMDWWVPIWHTYTYVSCQTSAHSVFFNGWGFLLVLHAVHFVFKFSLTWCKAWCSNLAALLCTIDDYTNNGAMLSVLHTYMCTYICNGIPSWSEDTLINRAPFAVLNMSCWNQDTSLTRTLSFIPSMSILKRFHCTAHIHICTYMLISLYKFYITQLTTSLLQVQVCVDIHQSVADASKQFLVELSRHNYVTPTSYLELLGTFGKLIQMKKSEVSTQRNRTKTGLDKVQ